MKDVFMLNVQMRCLHLVDNILLKRVMLFVFKLYDHPVSNF